MELVGFSNKKVFLAFLVFFTASAFVAAQVFEFLPAWTHTASSCAIDEGSLNLYSFQTSADMTFRPGIVSNNPIVARCNVLNPLDSGDPEWNTLILGYQDPDGRGNQFTVRAKLFSVDRPTGATSLIAFVSSDNSGETTRTEISTTFGYNFDFLHNEYFVQIELVRTHPSDNPAAFMVRLTRAETSG